MWLWNFWQQVTREKGESLIFIHGFTCILNCSTSSCSDLVVELENLLVPTVLISHDNCPASVPAETPPFRMMTGLHIWKLSLDRTLFISLIYYYSFAGSYLLTQRLVNFSITEIGSDQRNFVKHLKWLQKVVAIVYIVDLWQRCLSLISRKWEELSQKKTWLVTGITNSLHGAAYF